MSTPRNAFDLDRFVRAQDEAATFERALAELRAGRKRSHWIWFVFPQIAGLGSSPTARRFALPDLAAARAYLAHPVLGQRLRAGTAELVALGDSDPVAVLGGIDAIKVRSSMTLFGAADPGEELFSTVLDQWYAGEPDQETVRRL